MAKSTSGALSLSQVEECLPPWMVAMRNAAKAVVKQSDVEEIVRNQLDRAKKGDKAAIAFIFDQVLGGNELKGATFVQNVFQGDAARPDKPCKARPGSDEKIEVLRRRAAAGLSLSNGHDADHSGE